MSKLHRSLAEEARPDLEADETLLQWDEFTEYGGLRGGTWWTGLENDRQLGCLEGSSSF